MDIETMAEEERNEALLEAKIQQRLDHPNIIRFIEVFMAKKPYFTLNIVMDYADGNYLLIFC
jgi:serine/threonine protein kinase